MRLETNDLPQPSRTSRQQSLTGLNVINPIRSPQLPGHSTAVRCTSLASQTENPSTRQWYHHPYNRPLAYHLVAACAHWLPRPARLTLARAIAPLVRRMMPNEHEAVQCNLSRILSDADDTVIKRTANMLFQNFAVVFTDLLSLNRQPGTTQQHYLHDVHGIRHLHNALASSRGFIAATAHMGNWELASRLLLSFGRPLYVLMAPEQHVAVQRLLREDNNPDGLHLVTHAHGGSFIELLMALRRGAIVAVQADRATGHRSDIVTPFFDAPALFPGGLFTLAAAAQAAILPCFCLLRPDHRYNIFIEPAITVSRGHEDEAMPKMIQRLEHYIGMAPDQWFNFYDFWNTSST
jgi:lauroyl/myristoyl acyltransferase